MEYRFIAVVVLSLGLAVSDDSAFGLVLDSSYGAGLFPTDFLLATNLDGTTNIPVTNLNDVADPKVVINTLYGFATLPPIKRVITATLCSGFFDDEAVCVFKLAGLFNGRIANRLIASIHNRRVDV